MVYPEADRGWIGRVFLRWPRWCFRNDYHDIVFAWGLETEIVEAVSARLPFVAPEGRIAHLARTHLLSDGDMRV